MREHEDVRRDAFGHTTDPPSHNDTYQFSNARGAKRFCRGDDAPGDRRDPASRSHRPVISGRGKFIIHSGTNEPPYPRKKARTIGEEEEEERSTLV